MDWMHGYYARSGYSFDYQSAIMPVRLRWAAMFNKHLLPEKNFRYLDAGCGQGLTLIYAAAIHPDSEFVGIDFMPDHVAHGRRMAERCGLDNVTFIEGDFVDLANDPRELGEFDYAVCHGIATWISPVVRKSLFALIGQVLRPGGVFYNGYNCQPGWLAMMPFQRLALLEQQAGDTADPIGGARRRMQELDKASNAMYKAYPNLWSRLATLDGLDPAYLSQEYLNQHWQPVFVSDMIAELEAVKLNFLGAGTLTDIFDNVLPPPVRELLQKQPNVVLREQMRDYATMQNFRRDLYIKGKPLAWDVELSEVLRETRVMTNPLTPRPVQGEPFKLQGSTSELAGDFSAYSRLLDWIDNRGDDAAIGQLIDDESVHARKGRLLETLAMLLHGGWITSSLPGSNPRGPQIALAIARDACLGAPYRHLPMVATGSAIALSDTEIVLTRLVGESAKREDLGPQLLAILAKLRRQLVKDGKPLSDPAQLATYVDALVADFLTTRVPYLRKVGVLPAESAA